MSKSSQLEEIINVQLGPKWFRLRILWFCRENPLQTQTAMLLRILKFQLELLRHPFQVGYKFPQLLDLSTTVDIRFWKEALLELNTPLVIGAMKHVSSYSKMGGQPCSLADRQTFHPVFDSCVVDLRIVGESEFLLGPVFSVPEEANYGVCPN